MRVRVAVLTSLCWLGCGDAQLAPRTLLQLDPIPTSTSELVVHLTGRASAGSSLSVEGGAAPVGGTADVAGHFSVPVALRVGERNRLRVLATSADAPAGAGDVVVRQIEGPPLAIAARVLSPPSIESLPQEVSDTWLSFSGIAPEATAVIVRDPYQVQEVEPDGSGRFSAAVRLRRLSDSSISVSSEDAFGNRSPEVAVSVRHALGGLSAEPPGPPALDPADHLPTASRVTLAGQTSPRGWIRVEGGETPATAIADEQGRFEVGVALRLLQVNELSVRAVDSGARESAPTVVRLEQRAAPAGLRYPIVLAHGLGGSSQVLGIVPYWWGIAEALRGAGYEVLVGDVSPFHSVAHRAAQLRDQINRYTSGKVNIVGHSMGGLDARYLVSQLGFGDRVASVTSISTPHRGTPLADFAYDVAGPYAFAAGDLLLRQLGFSLAAVEEMRTTEMARFNEIVIDAPGVAYFSFAGRSDPLGQTGNFLAPYFVATWAGLKLAEGDNDGLVSISSARWGEYLGTIPADHMDEIGQFLGIADHFRPTEFYLELASYLGERGF